MGKNPGYLPASAWTVGAMIGDQLLVKWSCETCKAGGNADLLAIQRKRGPSYCLVDKVTRCKVVGCSGKVRFHYSGGPGTPTRPLAANRERQDAVKARAAAMKLEAARIAYNRIAMENGGLPLPSGRQLADLLAKGGRQ